MSIGANRLKRTAKSNQEPLDNPNTIRVGGSATRALSGTNMYRDDNQIVRYTRTPTQTTTPTNQYGVEVVVSIATGRVISVNNRIQSGSTAGTPIDTGTYVLSGHGNVPGYAGTWLLDYATVGTLIELITVVVDLTNFIATAQSTSSIKLDWSYTGAALSNFTLKRGSTTIASPAAGDRTFTDTGLTQGINYTYSITGNYQAGGTTTTLTTSRSTLSPVNGNLPAKLVGAYWQMYQGPTVAEITANAPQYNIQYAAFALGNGSNGTTHFSPAFQSPASLKADIAASKAAGCKWLISAGGGVPTSEQIFIRSQTEANQFVSSIISIIDEYGFQGIDFDLENGPNGWSPTYMTSVATQLKAHYGNSFIVSLVPRPYETYYFNTAVMMGDTCDIVGLQFYDYHMTSDTAWLKQWIRDKVNELVNNYGIPSRKILIGCITYHPEYGNGSNTVAAYRDAFVEMENIYPDLRGVFIWESSLDKKKNWEFARVMGSTVL